MPTIELTDKQLDILVYMAEDWVEGVDADSKQMMEDLKCTEEEIEEVKIMLERSQEGPRLIVRHNPPGAVDPPEYMVVDAETGETLDESYRSFEGAAKAWPEAINSKNPI